MSDIQNLTINDVCELQAGYGFESAKYKENGEPILRVTSLQNNQIDDSELKFFNPLDYSKNLEKHILHPNQIVISKDGTIGKVAFNDKERSFYLSSQLIKVIPKKGIHTKYLFHFLISKTRKIEQMTTGKSGILHLDLNKFKELKISVPPFEEQSRIAKELDKFRELERELNLRKQQYEYYRDEILSFKQDDKIKWLTLGEIAINAYRGSSITKNQLSKEGEPCIKYGEIYTTHKIWFDKCISYLGPNNLKKYRYCENGDLLFPSVGETKEDIGTCVAYLGKEKLIVDSNTIVIKHEQNPKFLSYAISTTHCQKQKSKFAHKNSLVYIKMENLKKIKIPIPSLEKQEEIANLLDKFWKISNNVREGLPAEILLSKQQYEYYRDKLLA